MYLDQRRLVELLETFNSFSTTLQRMVEDRVYYPSAPRDEFCNNLQPINQDIYEQEFSYPDCLSLRLFRSVFKYDIDKYINDKIYEMILNSGIEKGCVTPSEEYYLTVKPAGIKNVQCWVSKDGGLSVEDLDKVIEVAEYIVRKRILGAGRGHDLERLRDRNEIFERLLCRLTCQEKAIEAFLYTCGVPKKNVKMVKASKREIKKAH